jgi:hypothetical protein
VEPLALTPELPLAALEVALSGLVLLELGFKSWLSKALAPEILPIIVAFSCKSLPYRRVPAACGTGCGNRLPYGRTSGGPRSCHNWLISKSPGAFRAALGVLSRSTPPQGYCNRDAR